MWFMMRFKCCSWEVWLGVENKLIQPPREERQKSQRVFFPNAYLAENSKPPQFWVKQINYWLSIRKGSFSSVYALSGETDTWKIMQNLTWEILASLSSSRFGMKCPAGGRWVHHGSNLSLPLQLIHPLAQVSGEWVPKSPFLSHTEFLPAAEHMELNTCPLSIVHPSSSTRALTQTLQALPVEDIGKKQL